MKLKSLFLSMLGAAVFFSCNNDSIVNGPDVEQGGGQSTHATFSLDFGTKGSTYAGDATITATGYETTVSDAAIYIYDQSNAPEAMAYLANASIASPRNVTLKVASGAKKIFVALNVGHTSPNILPVSGFTTAALDTGVVFTDAFAALNNTLYSTATDITLAAPSGGTVVKGDGLIKTLAGGAIDVAKGGIYSTDAALSATESYTFMSNWDGPADRYSSGNYASECAFTLVGNISKAQSQVTSSPNYIQIGVQRAYAKISLRITAPVVSGGAYESEANKSQGRFSLWITGSDTVWALGGINKQEYPFQQFRGANDAVASPNYALSTQDTIIGANPATSDKWLIIMIIHVFSALKHTAQLVILLQMLKLP
jgi:hypothetical protein